MASGGSKRGREFHQPVGRLGDNSIDQVTCLRNVVNEPYGLADRYVTVSKSSVCWASSIFLISAAYVRKLFGRSIFQWSCI
jgi:hypothetical protein